MSRFRLPHNVDYAASRTGRDDICKIFGCPNYVYACNLCSEHWEPQPEVPCEHPERALVLCGRCGRRVCEGCYGPWNALACVECRERAS